MLCLLKARLQFSGYYLPLRIFLFQLIGTHGERLELLLLLAIVLHCRGELFRSRLEGNELLLYFPVSQSELSLQSLYLIAR
ncbi:Uncharacterised protein [Klebsiella michiganensis]|uniref:Uncharacterized protein n=1 Tax=Klebsiella michiganensis TaxID=1134687 RepID=A0A7H4LSJ1_9ENTR|nr:Uncharacterised protein [Klebsiella michiganensis]